MLFCLLDGFPLLVWWLWSSLAALFSPFFRSCFWQDARFVRRASLFVISSTLSGAEAGKQYKQYRLQVERRIPVHAVSEIPDWAHGHPHCKRVPYARLDSLYVATPQVHLPGTTMCCPGAGRFQRFANDLCLTAPERSRSLWLLPQWFYPRPSSCLSYHSDVQRWQRHEDGVLLRCVGRGQEFVLDCEHYPEALGWLERLLCLEMAACLQTEYPAML